MWRQAGGILGRLFGRRGLSAGGAADELSGMGSRELCDLGIGSSEIPFVLEGGGRDRNAQDNAPRSGARLAREEEPEARRVDLGAPLPAGI